MSLLLIMPTNAINVELNCDVGSVNKEITASDMTCYNGRTVIGQEAVLDSWDAGGPGKKSIRSQIRSRSGSHEISVENNGPLTASVTSIASPDAVVSCFDGKMGGDAALLKLASESGADGKYLTAGFSGEVSDDPDAVDAALSMVSAGRSKFGGGLTVLDVDVFSEGVPGDVSKVVNGLFVQPDGKSLGQFGAALVNVDKSSGRQISGATSEANVVSGTYNDYNDPTAWVAAGWRWQSNPNIQLYLRSDKTLTNEKLTATQAASAILAAANAWDAVTSQELFKNSISKSSTVAADKYDKKSVHAWKYISSGALAYSSTYYYPSVYVTGADGRPYYKAIESDVCYNTAYSWTTNANSAALYPASYTFNLQTVAEHEMGHTLGLGDAYLHDIYKFDTAQIMGFYDDINDISGNDRKVDLGQGDVSGIKTLYG